MLSVLLEAAVTAVKYHTEQAPALCPPCHEEEDFTYSGLFVSVLKSLVSVIVIVFPLYKTFKAWESDRIRVCKAMLAYWSCMTLLNCMKEVTDEVVGNWFNQTLHHLMVAAIKLAPLILGPDRIYDLTVRPFFEQHEEQIDSAIKAGNAQVQEVKNKVMEQAAPVIENMKDTVNPMIENAKETMNPIIENMKETVTTQFEQVKESMTPVLAGVKESLGFVKDDRDALTLEKEKAQKEHREYDAETAMIIDHQLNPTPSTGLKQRRKQLQEQQQSTTELPATVLASHQTEIEKAKEKDVLREKIIWGSGLSAKKEELQRQQQSKEIQQGEIMQDMHQVHQQYNLPSQPVQPQQVAADGAAAGAMHVSTTTSHPSSRATQSQIASGGSSSASSSSTTVLLTGSKPPSTPTTVLDGMHPTAATTVTGAPMTTVTGAPMTTVTGAPMTSVTGAPIAVAGGSATGVKSVVTEKHTYKLCD